MKVKSFLTRLCVLFLLLGSSAISAFAKAKPVPEKYFLYEKVEGGIVIKTFLHGNLPRKAQHEIIIPNKIKGHPVVALGKLAFSGYHRREEKKQMNTIVTLSWDRTIPPYSIRIPDTVVKIDNDCFKGSSVEKIILPKNLKEIGAGAF